MKEYNKKQLTQEFGKCIYERIDYKAEYLSGIEFFDSYIDSYIEKKKLKDQTFPVIFSKCSTGLVITLGLGFSIYQTGIHFYEIKYFTIEQQDKITYQKDKSVVGRALVGGLLLYPFIGPLGTVIGGMTGIGKKNIDITDYILIICFDDEGKDSFLQFSVKSKHLNAISKYLKTNFPHHFKNFNEIVKDEPKILNDNIFIADEIKKLKELLDIGALTQAEFDEQKQKLLKK